MAYSKTTWQNNVTDIDENNLNKIEQGIYDNSLVVDAVTNTLNPTDTETYKTAELTEGQITDVIGVNDIVIKGQTEQEGEPTPSSPVDVNVVSGSNVIDIYNNQTLSKELPLDLGSIELCKIGNYQDYFYKSGSKWYLHKEVGKITLNGNENWEQYSGNNNVFFAVINSSIMPLPKNESLNVFCDNYVSVLSTSSVTTFIDEASSLNYAVGVHVTSSVIRIKDTRYTSVTDLKTWLASNNVTLYYVLATATNTEITNTTLISQLEAIYNAPLYEQTNITQTNNDLPMVLDITACKDNINGIKAFIRK